MDPAEKRFAKWLETYVEEFRRRERELAESWWRAATRQSAETQVALERAEFEYRTFLAREDLRKDILEFQAESFLDPLLRRQHRLIRNQLELHHMDPETIGELVRHQVAVEAEFNAFRAHLEGEEVSDNDIKDVLRHTRDSDTARRAWEASKEIAPRVADRVRELARIRNRVARSKGYASYQDMALELNEIDPERLFAVLDELEKRTEAPFSRLKARIDEELAARFGAARDELWPWHYGDPFFQSPPATLPVDLDTYYAGKDLVEITERYYSAIGLEISDILARSDLFERPGKCQHAFASDIDREGDIRVLCNVRSDAHWMATMLHEFGHAVYDKYIDRDLPYLLREPAHLVATEAVAMYFGRLARDAAFLEELAGVPAGAARAAAAAAQEDLRRQQLVFVRWALAVVHFERLLYEDPERDLDAAWWRLAERFQKLRRPPEREAPDWAAKIHIATAPVYYQNYILGELTASQFSEAVRRAAGANGGAGGVSNPRVGEFFVSRVFRPGRSVTWEELIASATGEPLKADPFLAEFASGAEGPPAG